jgi:Peptidase family C54
VGVVAESNAGDQPQPPSLLYLDPHDARPAAAPLAHWCDAPRLLRIDGVDPSLALAFWCGGEGDWQALADGLASIEAAHPGAPLVSVRDGDGADAAAAAAGMADGEGECEEGGFELL